MRVLVGWRFLCQIEHRQHGGLGHEADFATKVAPSQISSVWKCVFRKTAQPSSTIHSHRDHNPFRLKGEGGSSGSHQSQRTGNAKPGWGRMFKEQMSSPSPRHRWPHHQSHKAELRNACFDERPKSPATAVLNRQSRGLVLPEATIMLKKSRKLRMTKSSCEILCHDLFTSRRPPFSEHVNRFSDEVAG